MVKQHQKNRMFFASVSLFIIVEALLLYKFPSTIGALMAVIFFALWLYCGLLFWRQEKSWSRFSKLLLGGKTYYLFPDTPRVRFESIETSLDKQSAVTKVTNQESSLELILKSVGEMVSVKGVSYSTKLVDGKWTNGDFIGENDQAWIYPERIYLIYFNATGFAVADVTGN